MIEEQFTSAEQEDHHQKSFARSWNCSASTPTRRKGLCSRRQAPDDLEGSSPISAPAAGVGGREEGIERAGQPRREPPHESFGINRAVGKLINTGVAATNNFVACVTLIKQRAQRTAIRSRAHVEHGAIEAATADLEAILKSHAPI